MIKYLSSQTNKEEFNQMKELKQLFQSKDI